MKVDMNEQKAEDKKLIIKLLKDIFETTKLIKNQTTEIGRLMVNGTKTETKKADGIRFKGPLPWQVTSKEVYMLSKQNYTMDELKLITRYSEDELKKKYNQHIKNNM